MRNSNKLIAVTVLLLGTFFLFQTNSYALVYPFNLTLSGVQEVPPNASPATGNIVGTYDDVTKIISFTVTWSGFIGFTTAAHFHGPAGPGFNAPVLIGFAGFPVGVQNGVYANNFNVNPVQEAHLLAGLVYCNLHSTVFPGGEIRAQMILDAPLPVELASFASVTSRNNVTLNWSTSSEINNSGFDIERKNSNSSEWTKIGNVTGNGTSSEIHNYSFSDLKLQSGTYNYRLKQIDFNGNFEYFNLSNEINIGLPSGYFVSQNYPNPFNPTTKIDYDVPVDGFVNITLYNLTGKEIAVLSNEFKTAGYHTIQFNASDLPSGVYFYRINAGDFSSTKKMQLIK